MACCKYEAASCLIYLSTNMYFYLVYTPGQLVVEPFPELLDGQAVQGVYGLHHVETPLPPRTAAVGDIDFGGPLPKLRRFRRNATTVIVATPATSSTTNTLASWGSRGTG